MKFDKIDLAKAKASPLGKPIAAGISKAKPIAAGVKAQLEEQRWDDHRYYHHSLINQSLHFLSASTFLVAYVLLFKDPAVASLLAWGVAMTSRQAGHFFFEPKGYDYSNDASQAHKEEIKVGYNLFRKIVFMSIWALMPLVLLVSPTLWGVFSDISGPMGFIRHVGAMWLALGAGGLLFRTVQLFFVRDVPTGLIWALKIITDPFNDFRQYRHAPMRLLKGERLDGVIATR
jgi:type IV secretory pathway VirB3-like protein